MRTITVRIRTGDEMRRGEKRLRRSQVDRLLFFFVFLLGVVGDAHRGAQDCDDVLPKCPKGTVGRTQ
jgi:hypothetical protein